MKTEDFVEIRFMKESDILQVKQIEQECKLSEWSLTDYIKELGRINSITLVLTRKKEVVGFMVARLIISSQFDLIDKSLNCSESEIYNIAVRVRFQKQGYGQKLLSKFIEICSNWNIKNIWLEVRKSNAKAIEFYTRNSFQFAYYRKNFYTSPTEDAVVLKLNI